MPDPAENAPRSATLGSNALTSLRRPTVPPPSAPTSDPVSEVRPPASAEPRLGELLVASGALSREGLARALSETSARHGTLAETVLALGLVEEADLYRALALEWRMTYASIETLVDVLDPKLARALPQAYLDHHPIVPLLRRGDDVIVAVTAPTELLEDVAHALGAKRAVPYLVCPTDFHRLQMLADVRARGVSAAPHAEGVVDLLAPGRGANEPRHIALFDAILLEAIAARASDVHLERYGERVRVRVRIDGDLHDLATVKLGADDLTGLVNVIKVNADLDIAERRVPQGGRIRRRAGGRVYNLRIQTQPALYGEHVVIRILAQEARLLSIEELGFPPVIATEYRRVLDSPGGLVLVVGPTGSGKSTTLYAGLAQVAEDTTRKVITIEDPIEYAVPGVQQSAVRPDLGFAFQHAMRAFVREDPDVILVGEIRDAETALEAIRASQTGHLVVSTLHCNDATDAVQRLLDLGVHPNSLASELSAVFAQRLAKRICDGCRQPAEPEPRILAELFPGRAPPEGFRCYVGRGCEHCAGRGTRGRIGVVELMRTSEPVRLAVAHRQAVDELRAVALGAGLVTMRSSALHLVAEGVIPLGELPWILSVERMAPEHRDGVE